VISPQSKKRIAELIQSGIDEGARIILDGRNTMVPPGFEKGNFVGPTILTDVKVHKKRRVHGWQCNEGEYYNFDFSVAPYAML
jgi:acyl-CoA reductase-like NAD-dependent aldehyde dehydrogenase